MGYVFDHHRRLLLGAGGGLLVLAAMPARVMAGDEVEIAMAGTTSGSDVWFRPHGLLIQAGQTVRWVNRDQGNVHTTTAYHPDNGKPLRIPENAPAWDSDYLMPGESFALRFDIPGVYDYYCTPHEHAGMVGRIVVGKTADTARPYADTDGLLPPAALKNLPDITKIMQQQVTRDSR